MKKKLLSLLQYILFLGLGIFLIWLSVRDLSANEWQQLVNSLKDAKYWLMIPVLGALMVSHWSRAIRWKILMQPLGYQPNTLNTFFAVIVGYLANLAIPRLGEVLKCTILARYEKIPADKLVGTIVAERAFDFICLLLVIFFTIITQVGVIGDFANKEFSNTLQNKTSALSWSGLITLVIVLLLLTIAAWFVLVKLKHLTVVKKIRAVIFGIWQGLTSVRHIKNKGAFFFHTAFIWVLYLASIRLGFYAMDATSHLGMKEALSVLSFGSIAMILTQGGIGAYQYLVQKVMLVYKVQEVEGLAFGWLLWGAQTGIILLTGVISLGLLPYLNRNKSARSV
ncbi:MAG TPA: lysylphosphatidylglycerol synthase transmembrane domain-containing protein [Parasegetibacter sp.]|jgi:uncharacterized membrane protein YbhN (UPF0104 family)